MIFSENQIDSLLDKLLQIPFETEWFEFKRTMEDTGTAKLGEYFSALSNEANLKNQPYGWLIFGIDDKTHEIIGTNYRNRDKKKLDDIKQDIANKCWLSFVQIYELEKKGNRLIIFQIPSALPGYPTKCDGHMYGRNGEHLGALDDAKILAIKQQTNLTDWTAGLVEEMSIKDIDEQAINIAKNGYIQKHQDLEKAVILWRDIPTFLTKIYAFRNEKITRAGALLLGKKEKVSLLFPWLEMSWLLKSENWTVLSYEHFKPPFIVAAPQILAKIRILTQSFLPHNSLMPIDIPSYDERVLRELLANAICHQDYTKQGRIGIQEFPTYLIIQNSGNFFSGSIEQVVEQEDFMPSSYRNPCLKDIMSEVKMIEYAGSGLRKVFISQKSRYMPMPSDLSTKDIVKIRIDGKIINENYAKLLYNNTEISLIDIIDLDKIQKGQSLSKEKMKSLKQKWLIEWRIPHCYISLGVAKTTGQVEAYLDAKWPELQHQKERILEYIKTRKEGATKKDILHFMSGKIEFALSEEEKYNRISNLLQELQRKGLIKVNKRWAYAKWFNV